MVVSHPKTTNQPTFAIIVYRGYTWWILGETPEIYKQSYIYYLSSKCVSTFSVDLQTCLQCQA